MQFCRNCQHIIKQEYQHIIYHCDARQYRIIKQGNNACEFFKMKAKKKRYANGFGGFYDRLFFK